jgi:hypothetical protein
MDDDPRLQKRDWAVQRLGRWLLLLLLAGVAMGLFGRGGPLGAVHVARPDRSLAVDYDRFIRHHSPDTIRLTARAAGNTTLLSMDVRYAGQIQIEQITPQPEREIGSDGAVTFVFAADFILFLILILILILSESIQNALIDEDKSVIMGLTVILTFLMLDLGLSFLKRKYPAFEKLAEGVPLLLVDQGKVIEENAIRSRITDSDILQMARQTGGIERMSQIKYAVLETSGTSRSSRWSTTKKLRWAQGCASLSASSTPCSTGCRQTRTVPAPK